jgi:hypothetical protein
VDPARYCREVETYLCRKNDGHLVRLVGPAFEKVAGWAARGIPLKLVFRGIDRYFERYYARGPRRFPVRIEFCESDILDLFDQWRRALGVTDPGAAERPPRRRARSLPAHLDRLVARLTVARAAAGGPGDLGAVLDRVVAELEALRSQAPRARGAARAALLARLDALDRELREAARQSVSQELLEAARREAEADLASFRERMAPDAFAAALERAVDRELRERLNLPRLPLEPGG